MPVTANRSTSTEASDDQDEARWVVNTCQGMRPETPWSEMAILVRTNAQTRAFEEELVRQQVPYELVGGVRFYERAEIKDLVAYLRIIHNPRDNFSFLRILNQPPARHRQGHTRPSGEPGR